MNRFASRTASALTLVALMLIACVNATAQTGPIHGSAPAGKGNLHVFSAGISNAQNQPYVYGPKQNARAHDAFWAEQGGKLYGRVFRHRLLNEEATRQRFLAELDRLVEQAQAGDTAALYLCGHGGCVGANNEWLFAVYDGDVSETEIRDRVVRLARKGVCVLLILDSCHSGAVEIREPNVIVFASCTKEQVARAAEDDGKDSLSLFTRILLHGLSGGADLNKDGVVTLAELTAYVSLVIEDEIKQAQQQGRPLKMQQPTCGQPSNVPCALPLAKVVSGPVPAPSR